MEDHEMMAACGLLCGPCPIRRMIFDKEVAKGVISWYKGEGWLKEDEGLEDAIEKKMYCMGCHGDRAVHWSANCEILQCCVDECIEFPCNKFDKYAKDKGKYAEALVRLKGLKGAKK